MPKPTSNILEDATKDLILEVLPIDISRSTSKDPANCVFAKCAMRQINADEALIFRTRAYIRKGNVWKRYLVTEAVKRELIVFDRGGKPEGGKFLLKRPHPSAELGLPRRGERNRNSNVKRRKKQGPRVVFHRTGSIRYEGSRGVLLMERLGV